MKTPAARLSEGRAGGSACADFLISVNCRAVPYGIDDIAENAGWVSVGIDDDSASFAVNAIRRWSAVDGAAAIPMPIDLTITADGGGSKKPAPA